MMTNSAEIEHKKRPPAYINIRNRSLTSQYEQNGNSNNSNMKQQPTINIWNMKDN